MRTTFDIGNEAENGTKQSGTSPADEFRILGEAQILDDAKRDAR